MKRISLIVPVWNGEDYVAQLAESVLSQGWDNLQLIFSDNGSTDGTLAILDGLAARDSRVIVLRGPHDGVSAGRNRALQIADGDYIGFSDADDVLAPGYFCALAGLLETHNADCACCGFDRIYAASGKADRMPPAPADPAPVCTDRSGFYSRLLRPDGYTTVVWNKLFRREALLNPDGSPILFDEALHIVEDGEYLFRTNVRTAVFTPEAYYRYTVRTTGAMYGAVTPAKLTEPAARRKIVALAEAEALGDDVVALAKMKYQKGIRDMCFHALLSGNRTEVRPFFGEMRTWRRELFTSPYLSKKEKLKYLIYRPLILLKLRRTGTFLMARLSGH